jgi:hypothetical protein
MSETKKRFPIIALCLVLIFLAAALFLNSKDKKTEPQIVSAKSADKAWPKRRIVPAKKKSPPKNVKPYKQKQEEPSPKSTAKSVKCSKESFDVDGFLVSAYKDKNCDGKKEKCMDFVYNEFDEMVLQEEDTDCDGKVDVCHHREYDDNGEVVYFSADDNCDGEVGKRDYSFCVEYKFNGEGLAVEEKWLINCDEKDTINYSRKYGANKNEIIEISGPPDGSYSICDVLTNDDQGNEITSVKCDEDSKFRWDRYYNDNGDEIAFTSTGMGVYGPSCTIYTYEQDGTKREEQIEGDCTERLEGMGITLRFNPADQPNK